MPPVAPRPLRRRAASIAAQAAAKSARAAIGQATPGPGWPAVKSAWIVQKKK